MKTANKLLTVLAVFIVLMILTGIGAFKPGASAKSGLISLGGVDSRMPENSAMVFFSSTLGQSLSKYKSYKNMDETLCALRSGEVNTIWACDVTADFLLKTNTDLKLTEPETMADIQKTEAPRFSFGMALKDTESSAKLRDDINTALADIKSDGTLDSLVYVYIENADSQEVLLEKAKFYPENMKQTGNGTVYVGISGAVQPVEMIDRDGEPYGFCVALMDEIGSRIGKKIKFVVLDNETAFTSLMSGRVDMIFCYGTGMKTTETKLSYIVTDGYLEMQKYEFLTLKD